MSAPASVTQLIRASGNSFHAKVAEWFNTNGWHTRISPYYMDQNQSKARELDLVVEKLWDIRSGFNEYQGDLIVRLFVECKFVASEVVFWFTPKDLVAATNLVCGLGPYHENNTYTFKHHYISTCPTVAKLFASGVVKTPEAEPIYKALNQSLNATVAMRSRPPSHPKASSRRHGKLIVLNYPVVVCSSFSQLYAVDFLSNTTPTPIGSNFQLEVQYAFYDQSGAPREELFLLDFVDFAQLGSFESAIAQGAEAGAYLAAVG